MSTKHCVTVCATHSGVNSANRWGPGRNGLKNECSTKPTKKCTQSMLYVIRKFSFFYFLGVSWSPGSIAA